MPRAFDEQALPEAARRALQAGRALERLCIQQGCDQDGDGIDDLEDLCPEDSDPQQLDKDGDGFGVVCDDDDDNNGVPDIAEDCLAAAAGVLACDVVLTELFDIATGIADLAVELHGDIEVVKLQLLQSRSVVLVGQPPVLAVPGLRAAAEGVAPMGSGDLLGPTRVFHSLANVLADGLSRSPLLATGRVCSRGDVTLAGGTRVEGGTTNPGLVAVGSLVLQSGASLDGSVAVGCDLILEDGAHLTGRATIGRTPTIANAAVVTGGIDSFPCDTCSNRLLMDACDVGLDVGVFLAAGELLLETSRSLLAIIAPTINMDEQGRVVFGSNVSVELPAGLFVFRSIAVGDGATITSSGGQTVLVALEDLWVGHGAVVGNGHLTIVVASSSEILLDSGTRLHADLIAPDSALTIVDHGVRCEGSLDVGGLYIAAGAELIVPPPGIAVDANRVCGL